MKKRCLVAISLNLIALLNLGVTSGCVSRERVTKYEVTKTGKDWIHTESVMEKGNGQNRKLTIEKKNFCEKIRCVGKNGKKIEVFSPEECFKVGGKLIDEVLEERIIEKTR